MVRREREEKIAFSVLLAQLLGPMSRLPLENLESILGTYRQHVNHDVYRKPPRARKDAKVARENAALLAKVDRLTVPDDELPMTPPPKKPGGKRRR